MWKDRMKNIIGTKVYVPYDKTKSVKWTVEKIIENKNIHVKESSDFHPVYDYRHMDPSKINPLKNFLENFPEEEQTLGDLCRKFNFRKSEKFSVSVSVIQV